MEIEICVCGGPHKKREHSKKAGHLNKSGVLGNSGKTLKIRPKIKNPAKRYKSGKHVNIQQTGAIAKVRPHLQNNDNNNNTDDNDDNDNNKDNNSNNNYNENI